MQKNEITLCMHFAASRIWQEACFERECSLRQCAEMLLKHLEKETDPQFSLSAHTLFYDALTGSCLDPDIPLSMMNAPDAAVIEIY